MTTGALLGFTVVALLGVLTPGLDTMLILRNSILGGRRRGAAALLGISAGCLVWGSASVLGLTALLTASHLAYNAVRIAGAAYLLWLGGSALWKSLRRKRETVERAVPAAPSWWMAFRSGMLTNLLNPKVGVFYMSLLPQFIPAGAPAWGAVLVLIHIGAGLVWLGSLVWAATKAKRFLSRDAVQRWLDRVTATVLIGLGVKLAVEVG